MTALKQRRQAALSDAGMAALGVKGAKQDLLRTYADLSKCSAIFPGEPVFGAGRENCVALVLWGEVKDPRYAQAQLQRAGAFLNCRRFRVCH